MFEGEEIVNINKVNFLQKKKSTFLLKTIKKYIKSFSKNNLPRNVKVIYYNKTSTLVPSDLFDSKNSLNYLKYNTTIQIDDLTANDLILDEEADSTELDDELLEDDEQDTVPLEEITDVPSSESEEN